MSKVNTLVLDAGPLITQSASQLQQFGSNFYTTPGVFSELKDEHARKQILIWGDKLQVRQPKPNAINAVIEFTKLTGDYLVLSQNDLHILALTYELECQLNNGPWRLRSYPGEKKKRKPKEQQKENSKESVNVSDEAESSHEPEFEPVEKIKKKTRRGGKRHRKKPTDNQEHTTEDDKNLDEVREIPAEDSQASTEDLTEVIDKVDKLSVEDHLSQEFSDAEDEGEWITPENLIEEMMKDENEKVESSADIQKVKVALSTGDFAVQNVALQIGLNLMNAMSGMQIKRVRNYMLRCHACFTMIPIPKDGTPKHFCSACGGATLLRCAVSVVANGNIIPHLKKNFEWHRRGDKYSLPSPQSKNYAKKYGSQGYQHRGNPLLENVYLREDQKEYQQALKNAKWQLRQNEKVMQEYVGGGSADNFISPFFTGTEHIKPVNVKVGRGRYVNSSRRRR